MSQDQVKQSGNEEWLIISMSNKKDDIRKVTIKYIIMEVTDVHSQLLNW